MMHLRPGAREGPKRDRATRLQSDSPANAIPTVTGLESWGQTRTKYRASAAGFQAGIKEILAMTRKIRHRCDFLKACNVLWVVLVDKQTQTHASIFLGLNLGLNLGTVSRKGYWQR